jgi:hypothetical protein
MPAAADEDTDRALATLKAVAREGKSNDAAGPAWKTIVSKGVPALIPALAAVDDANPTAANWLRTAAGAIAEAETQAGRKLPAADLEAFATNTKHAPSARRLAFELIVGQDPAAKDRLLPTFLNDPGRDLRRDAIAYQLDKLKADGGGPPATDGLKKLFAAARDVDQVEDIAARLEKLGTKASVSEHLGYVTHWSLVGPFESAEGKALTTSHPPEKATDTAGKFPGKDGEERSWKPVAAGATPGQGKDAKKVYGEVNLNSVIGKHKNAAVYALAVVRADKPTPAEVRVTSPNAVQVFVNGAKAFEREEYHHGAAQDYHLAKTTLKPGDNVIVLKIAQNNQAEIWAQLWQFQSRICDATGGPLPGVRQVLRHGGAEKLVPLGHIPEAEEKK